MRLLAFYFWHHVMLHTLQVDNTIGQYYLCCILHVLNMIIKSGAICTSVHLYTIIIGTDGVVVYMWPCMLLVIACTLYYWLNVHGCSMLIYVDITELWITSILFFVSIILWHVLFAICFFFFLYTHIHNLWFWTGPSTLQHSHSHLY